MNNIKPAVVSLALAALLSPLSALAIGLGAASVKSSLYEPLRADVALSVNAGEDITGASFVIASPAKFAQAGLPYPAWVADLTASVERSGKTARLRLRSTKPIYEPMARILIEARLPNGSALLPVTLMLDTPFSKPLGSELAPMLPGDAQERKPQPGKAKGKPRAQAEPGAPAPARAKARPSAPERPAPAARSGSEGDASKAAASVSPSTLAEPAAPAVDKPKAPSPSAPLDASASASASAALSAPAANSDSSASPAALASGAASSESVALPPSEEPAASPAPAASAPAPTPLAAAASAPAQPAFGSALEPPAADSGLFGLPSWWPWIGGSLALLAAAAASWARARRKRSYGSEELSVTTSSEAYSATEEALGQRSAPYFEEPAPEPEAPQASSFGPSSDAVDLSSLDSFLSQAADLPQGPSLAKPEPDFSSPDFASSLDDELSKAVSGGSSSAHELHQIDSLREEVFSNEFRIDSSFDIRPATPLAPMAKTREDFTFESLNEQVKAPSEDTLRPILSDPESFRAPEPDSNLMAFEPFQAPVLAPAPKTAADHSHEPFSFSLEPPEDSFSQAEALSQSAQGRSAPLALGEAFKVDDSVGERPGRLQLELACLYAQSEDWDGARASLNEVLADAESSEAHPEARRLMALIP